MKKDATKVLLTACCIGMALSLFQSCQLRKEVAELKNLTSSQIRSLHSSVENLSGVMDQKLEEGASLLSASEWSYLGADITAREVSVLCKVTPKAFDEELTEAVLVWKGQEYPMELRQGSYETEISIPLFEDTQIEKVLFRTGNEIQTEQLNWGLNPRQEYLTMVYGYFSGSWTGGPADQGKYGCQMKGTVRIEAERKGQAPELLSAVLVEKVNDTEVQRTELVLAKAEEEIGAAGRLSYENPVCYTCEIERDYEIPDGGSIELSIEAMDRDRLVHYVLAERLVAEDGTLDRDEDCWWLYGAEAAIYDENGRPLYVPEQ